MDIRQIKTFVHIADLHSFSRASAFLHVSQPALSRQMRLLEEELGIKLFHRHGHGAELTEDGALFHQRSRKILADFLNLKSEFYSRGRNADITGTVGIGLPVPATRFIGVEFINAFRERSSGISLKIVEGFSALLHEWLLSGSLDLAVQYGGRSTTAITAEPVLTEDLYAVTGAGTLLAEQASVRASDLASMPLILPNRPHVLRDLIDDLELEDARTVEVGAISLMFDMARVGKGVTILPRSSLDPALGTGGLVALPIHDPYLTWEVSICYSALKPLTPAAMVVRDELRNELIKTAQVLGKGARPLPPEATSARKAKLGEPSSPNLGSPDDDSSQHVESEV